MNKYLIKKIALTTSLAVLFGAGLALKKDIKYTKIVPINEIQILKDNENFKEYINDSKYALVDVCEPTYKLLIRKVFK